MLPLVYLCDGGNIGCGFRRVCQLLTIYRMARASRISSNDPKELAGTEAPDLGTMVRAPLGARRIQVPPAVHIGFLKPVFRFTQIPCARIGNRLRQILLLEGARSTFTVNAPIGAWGPPGYRLPAWDF